MTFLSRLLTALFTLLSATRLFALEHPGGMHPASQLDFVRQQVKQKKEPYYTAYLQLLRKADSVLTAPHHALVDFSVPGYYVKPQEHRANSLAIQQDGFSAYACALAWQLSGKRAYAEKALYFLNAWASINKGYSDFDGPLVMSYSGTSLLMAAELVRPFKRWKTAGRQQFAGWVENVYRKAANAIRGRKNNWADWGRMGSLLAACYLDDTAEIAENVRLIKSDLSHKIADDGSMPEETRREKNGIWYTYFSLAPITASCWIVHNATGEDLFTQTPIKKALDYLLYYNQHPQEWKWYKDPNTGKPGATGFWPANLFVAMYGIYGDPAYKAFTQPHEPIIYEQHHFAWTFPSLTPVKLTPSAP
ncbi:alginate lyase family protein [Chitinophaga lutea]